MLLNREHHPFAQTFSTCTCPVLAPWADRVGLPGSVGSPPRVRNLTVLSLKVALSCHFIIILSNRLNLHSPMPTLHPLHCRLHLAFLFLLPPLLAARLSHCWEGRLSPGCCPQTVYFLSQMTLDQGSGSLLPSAEAHGLAERRR